MTRISRDEWGLRLAEVTALRGTCLRRRVGCVLVDTAGVVLATGYNGVARGVPHCDEVTTDPNWSSDGSERYPYACPGAGAPSGIGLDMCHAIHAEANALMACATVPAIDTCYVTVSPCVSCVKMLMNTGCRRLVFREPYATAHEHAARMLWTAGQRRTWECLP